ncbi:MAG TPA: AMP-binding protein, partial [Thermoanaerobaculia bacterium]|nr:AMP-binding protein [Thermoanaerobaculia bacterium]
MNETVIDLLRRATARWRDEPAMKVKRNHGWHTTTWGEYHDQVMLAGRALMALGLEPGKGIVISGNNRPEWFLSNLGAIAAGGIPAGIYTTSSPEQCAYIADHAEAAVAVLETPELVAKFLQQRSTMPGLRAIVLMEGEHEDPLVLSWNEFLAHADRVPEDQLEDRIARLDPAALCSLIYTSGTTGPPKAVMLSHTNVVWTSAVSKQMLDLGENDQLLSYLPLSHIAEQIVTQYIP